MLKIQAEMKRKQD